MDTTFPPQRSTLRAIIETAAGMHTAPVAGTRTMLFGSCDVGKHERCPERAVIGLGTTRYTCSCDCHLDPELDPADWDAAYGPSWGVAVDEGE